MEKVIILGTGPAGLTAAIYLARANMKPIIIEGDQPGGQLTLTTEVENFPGFIDGIMGPELMDNMRKQAERFGAQFKRGWVTEVDLSKKPFRLQVNGLGEIETESLILSTGASAKLLNIPGEKENIGVGVSTCATCDGFFFRNKKVIIVGGGDSAMEEANFLTKFASEVIIVNRRNELRASKIMQDRAKENPKISWQLNQTPLEVMAGDKGVTGLKVKDNETNEEKIIETDGIFVAIGHTPNTSFLDGQIDTDDTGYINVIPGTTETNVPGVFACGDVQDKKYRQAITAAGTGCMAALDAERYLEGNAIHDWSQSLGGNAMTTKNYHELLKDRIFIGGADDIHDVMKNENVDVAFDLRAEAPKEESPYNRVHSPIVDDADQQDESVKNSIDHVVNTYNEGKKVYFHCQGGSNRTGTVAIGTLLALGKAKTIEEAEDIAKTARPKINVKPEMKETLKRIYPNS